MYRLMTDSAITAISIRGPMTPPSSFFWCANIYIYTHTHIYIFLLELTVTCLIFAFFFSRRESVRIGGKKDINNGWIFLSLLCVYFLSVSCCEQVEEETEMFIFRYVNYRRRRRRLSVLDNIYNLYYNVNK